MPEHTERLSWLYKRFLSDTATPEEVKEFLSLMETAEEGALQQEAAQLLEAPVPAAIEQKDWSQSFKRITGGHQKPPVHRMMTRWVAAASVILIMSVCGYFILGNKSESTSEQRTATLISDITPGSNKAILTLADGSRLSLDSVSSGTLAMQGNTRIVKRPTGEVDYQASGHAGSVSYNTMLTPRGGQYSLRLPDGTKVWLNAASSITYPTAFIGNNRTVKITGEAYFEVTKNKRKPFIVQVDDQTAVEVLGTRFNVNAYPNEISMNTTLLEGAVRIGSGSGQQVLQPGQQAQANKTTINVINNVDVDRVMAWKNGHFQFDGEGLEVVMRQLERWYDVEVVYEGAIPKRELVGTISRNVNASEVLKMLSFVGGIRYRIEGKKIFITP